MLSMSSFFRVFLLFLIYVTKLFSCLQQSSRKFGLAEHTKSFFEEKKKDRFVGLAIPKDFLSLRLCFFSLMMTSFTCTDISLDFILKSTPDLLAALFVLKLF